jgi:(p)ppGpp synthase/HD superfamily hydrolase
MNMTEQKIGEISLIDRAIGFAAKAHKGQKRKSDKKMPYIAHPFGVAMILEQMGCSETAVAAGLLHDTVEDTPVTIEQIRSKFGQEVADIVAGCTEPTQKYDNWEERKTHMIESLREASLEIKLVVAADKYHNLNLTLASSKTLGKDVWKPFSRPLKQQAWYYRNVYESILANLPGSEEYAIFEELGKLINELFDGVPSSPP